MRLPGYRVPVDVALLRTFVAVARAGSFAAVARGRDADPSSVSRQVAALEAELGVRLFDRTTRRLVATEAGRLYAMRVAPLLDGLELAHDEVADAVSAPRGLLRVTASVAFGERWLVPRIARFRAAWPDVEVELLLTDAVVDLSADGVDVALRLGTGVEGALVATRLMDTRYRAVASPGFLERHGRPATPADLVRHDCLAFALPGHRSRWRFRRPGADDVDEVEPTGALAISNALGLRRAALDGLGVALLADWTVDDDVAAGALLDLFPDRDASPTGFDTAAWIVYPERAYVPAKLRAFIDCLKAERA